MKRIALVLLCTVGVLAFGATALASNGHENDHDDCGNHYGDPDHITDNTFSSESKEHPECPSSTTTIPPTSSTVTPTTVGSTTIPTTIPNPSTTTDPSLPTTTLGQPSTTISSTTNPSTIVATNDPPTPCQEDEPCWDCLTMGNKVCGETLPATGANTVWIAAIATLLLLIGCWCLWIRRVTKVTK